MGRSNERTPRYLRISHNTTKGSIDNLLLSEALLRYGDKHGYFKAYFLFRVLPSALLIIASIGVIIFLGSLQTKSEIPPKRVIQSTSNNPLSEFYNQETAEGAAKTNAIPPQEYIVEVFDVQKYGDGVLVTIAIANIGNTEYNDVFIKFDLYAGEERATYETLFPRMGDFTPGYTFTHQTGTDYAIKVKSQDITGYDLALVY